MTLAKQPMMALQPMTQGFDQLVDLTLLDVAPTSARVYRQTFALWATWAAANGLDSLDFSPGGVIAFLAAQNVVKATRQRQLSAFRKLARMLYVLMPTEDTRRVVEGLNMIKAPVGGESGIERTRRALAPREADKVLRVWELPTATHRRNQALISVLALAALRRSEAAALRWRDIDFENGVITVQHGKGDKRREVPVAGELALDALRAWQMCLTPGREFVFCRITRHGDQPGPDKSISGTDVYRIVKATEAASGVEFKPHDLRRTFITEALATGTPLATVQAAAGHARGETTLRYAQAVDARRARKELKLRYG